MPQQIYKKVKQMENKQNTRGHCKTSNTDSYQTHTTKPAIGKNTKNISKPYNNLKIFKQENTTNQKINKHTLNNQ